MSMTESFDMKKLLASLMVIFAVQSPVFFCDSAHAAEPARADILLMKHTLETLWTLKIMESHELPQEELAASSLAFLIHGVGAECGLEREFSPEAFQNIPHYYSAFIKKEAVEEAAERVFNQKLTNHVPPKGFLFANGGYYIDFTAIPWNEGGTLLGGITDDDRLPGYTAASVRNLDDECMLMGTFRRFKDVEKQEILWKYAAFKAMFRLENGKWILKEFMITEEAMG